MNYWAINVSFLLRLLAYVTTIPKNYGIDACSERLSNYTIYLLDEDGNEIWSNHQIDMPNPNVSISVTGKGRYIKIQLDGENYLSLAEVQVYGK